MMERLTLGSATAKLAGAGGGEHVTLFLHGSLQVELYKPHKIDRQQPHTRDEVYVVASGSGYFVNDGAREKFETGEVLFVPAGVNHHFEDFSDDFSTWVFFFGPTGGEGEGA